MQCLLGIQPCALSSTVSSQTIWWGQWSKTVLQIVRAVNLCLDESILVFIMSKQVTILMLICFSICAMHFERMWGTGLMIPKCVSPFCITVLMAWWRNHLSWRQILGDVLSLVCSEWRQKIHIHGAWNMVSFTILLEMSIPPTLIMMSSWPFAVPNEIFSNFSLASECVLCSSKVTVSCYMFLKELLNQSV